VLEVLIDSSLLRSGILAAHSSETTLSRSGLSVKNAGELSIALVVFSFQVGGSHYENVSGVFFEKG